VILVVIDPGHGGKDPGAVSPGGEQEKEQVLKIARQIKALEAGFGGKVRFYLTRDGDWELSPEARANLANRLQARYFISLHQNSDRKHQGRGVEVYALAPGGEGEKLAHRLLESLVEMTGLRNRGVKFANFAVLRLTKMPAVLCECGFLGTPQEAEIITKPSFHRLAALAICKGLADYLGCPFRESWGTDSLSRLQQLGLLPLDVEPYEEVIWKELASVVERLLEVEGKLKVLREDLK